MCIFKTGDSGNGWIIILSVYIEPEAQRETLGWSVRR